ncbi:glycosyltransferase family 4 protein [Cupriavidus malaysiensis]|uniref:Glycosyltransferase family 1 protein n=1 Tax=Cupriavidus malaysiensis TaxID=367825 RepID=A0ABM6F2F2_9BURK|nr:glycosyltransferase family 4 protein [Cupriavidus malaysiensis]AOZ05348.1 glycosyltransferase family 1 protein [Cupriavidus malaysiensis]
MKFLLIAGLADSLLNFRGPLIAALQSRNLEVHVAAPSLGQGSPLRGRLEAMGLKVHDLPLRRTSKSIVSDLVTVIGLLRVMARVKPTYVMSYTIKPVIYGSLAAWLSRVPFRFALVTGLGYSFQGEGERGRLLALVRRLYRFSLARVRLVFFQNPDDENLFRELGILSPKVSSCVVNGSGIDISSFLPAPLPPGPPRFLLIARLLGDKGVREYVQAAKRVREIRPDVKFGLVGWIDENPNSIGHSELSSWIAEGSVEYLGKLSDVRPAIAESSVYVLPSYREGTPRTVLEAMAMGRPIITTDAPGCRETVQDGVTGFMVPVRSVDGLYEAMMKFAATPHLIGEMGARAREMAENKYDVRKVNEAMLRQMGIL